ncbi:hypothetical protein WN48_07859 [Eufriesea mexicana]|nr:hypothetical protein WN48_07859 [Eufriesea mexicana]
MFGVRDPLSVWATKNAWESVIGKESMGIDEDSMNGLNKGTRARARESLDRV